MSNSEQQQQQYTSENADTASNSSDSQQNVQAQGNTNNASNSTNTTRPAHVSKQTNLQRIQQLKEKELSLPFPKKLLRLANFSKCQVIILSIGNYFAKNQKNIFYYRWKNVNA